MDKGKGVAVSGRRWAVDFIDNSTNPSSRDIPDPLGFSRSSNDQVLLSIYHLCVCIILLLVCDI